MNNVMYIIILLISFQPLRAIHFSVILKMKLSSFGDRNFEFMISKKKKSPRRAEIFDILVFYNNLQKFAIDGICRSCISGNGYSIFRNSEFAGRNWSKNHITRFD